MNLRKTRPRHQLRRLARAWTRHRGQYLLCLLVLTVCALRTAYHPGGLLAYLFPSACWAALALISLRLAGGPDKIASWASRRITLMAILVAAFQIFITIDAGLINGFGRSPLDFKPPQLALNLLVVATTTLGTELSRGYLARTLHRRSPMLTLGLVTSLYTLTSVPLPSLTARGDPLSYSKFMGESFLPSLTRSLLASYLGLIGGPAASLAYSAPLRAFPWLSPILPDLPWGYESLIGVMTPTVGFVAITQATSRRDLRRAGISAPPTRSHAPREDMRGWMILSILLVLTTWASTGLLGFQPRVVASGSMRPALDVGDMAVIAEAEPGEIRIGDVIQYRRDGVTILHRVVEIVEEGGSMRLRTKGDANDAPDPYPVPQVQVTGRLILTIPGLGWASILARTALHGILSLTPVKPPPYAAAILVLLPASIHAIRRDRKRRRRR